jgi:hypothetical protein
MGFAVNRLAADDSYHPDGRSLNAISPAPKLQADLGMRETQR